MERRLCVKVARCRGGISSVCQGGYRDMDRIEKMDCRANGEAVFRALRVLVLIL